jgi:hypothetical protein
MASRAKAGIVAAALAGAALVFVAAVALLEDPVARWVTKRELASVPGVVGTFQSVHVSALKRSYRLDGLKLVVNNEDFLGVTLVTVDHLEGHLWGRELLRGRLTASATVVKPKVEIRIAKGGPANVPDPGAALRGVPPARLARVDVHDCEVLLTDATISPNGKLWVHDLEVELENLATRPKLAREGTPSFAVHGAVQHSGALKASGTLDPLASTPTVKGELQLTGLQMSALYSLIAPRTGLQITKGSVSASGTLGASDGRLRVEFEPVFNGLVIHSAQGNVFNIVEAAAANAALGALPDRLAASHPEKLDVKWASPGTLWEEMIDMIERAFAAAVESSLTGAKAAPADSSPNTSKTATSGSSPSRSKPPAAH